VGSSAQHLALVYQGQRLGVEVRAVETGQPDPGGALIAIDYAGVCGTDLDILRGARPETPSILGHEAIGCILVSRLAAPEYATGASVIFNPVSALDQRDILGHTFPGIWQTRRVVTAEEIQHGHVVPCKEQLSPLAGTLIEPLGTVLYGLGLIRQCIAPRSMAIIGSGMIGLLFAIEARRQGVQRIVMLGTSRSRLDWAAAAGILSGTEAVHVERQTGRPRDNTLLEGAFDAVAVCVPRQSASSAISTSTRLVRSGGVIDLVGGVADHVRHSMLPGVELSAVRRANVRGEPQLGAVRPAVSVDGKDLHLTGHRGTSPEHLHRAAAILATNGGKHTSIITHIVPLRRARHVLSHLLHNREKPLLDHHVVKVAIEVNDRLEEIRPVVHWGYESGGA
jgi:2-epi-valiolone-7-phosphate 1-reductase